MDYASELDVARAAAAKASEYLRSAYDAFTPIPDAPASISTEADRTSQDLILNYLAGAFPDDALCAEEGTAALRGAKREGRRLWVVDPIDGTRGFVMKNGEFSVMIGLVADGQVVVGVVAEPALARVTFASLGKGCWVRMGDGNPTRCDVTTTGELSAATLVQSHAKKGETPWPVAALKPRKIVETYSAGVKMAMVARGEVDMYVNTYANFSDWDICAGDILVTEAGGKATEIAGTPLRYGTPGNAQRGGLLATNSRLHETAVLKLGRR
ncbi:MAG TPA: inositol monophosphatase family protein [Gemmataceae bacterium]|nr:inositol monophosphatase family protein [Gemmataceae bacterium]